MALFLSSVFTAMAPGGTIYLLEAPEEPNAIRLGTGSVDNQPSSETWFLQWGDPMARNISTATLTPFLPDPEKAKGTAVIVAPGGGFSWLSMGMVGKLQRLLQSRELQPSYLNIVSTLLQSPWKISRNG